VKSPSDPADPVAGLRSCLDLLAQELGIDRRSLLSRTAKLAYGTTQAANVVVEGKAARTGFITTRGFRDTLIIAGIGRERIGIDLGDSRAPSLVPRRLIREVRERVDAGGTELAPVNVDDVRSAIEFLEQEGVEAVGVCLLWSFRNPTHEEQVATMLRDHNGWFVTTSAEVAPLLGEYERSATTALNAGLGPPIAGHLQGVEKDLRADGLAAPLLVMQSSGGLLPVAEALRRPVTLLASGPAGGVLAGKLIADAMGIANALCVDMGGTTFDLSMITDGEYAARDRTEVAGQELFLPAIDVRSIGAGGGSLGWVDHGVRLKVGPRSAGARPGPACYGRGGTQATVTDANCVLGRLNPDGLAGGRLPLDPAAATGALGALGAELGMDAVETAEGMITIVDAAMADAIRSQTVRRGIDPAEYTLIAFGGAGPLHVAALARELGISTIVVPSLAPVLSAYGVAASDIRHVLAVTEARSVDDVDALAAAYSRLEAEAERLLDADGIPPERRGLVRSAQVRFGGQLHAVDVAVGDGPVATALERIAEDFVARYERLFGPGTGSVGAGIEVITVRVDGIGRSPYPSLERMPDRSRQAPAEGRRKARWDGRWWEATRHLEAAAGDSLTGPAVVDLPGHTVWIPPGVKARVDGFGSVVMEVTG
jgi:N-methylhydantoinase A